MIPHKAKRRFVERWGTSRWVPLAVGAAALLILAGTIVATTQHLRRQLRDQIVGRDTAVLHAVTFMHERIYSEDADTVGDVLGAEDDPSSHFSILLETSRMAGVLGTRLFSREGEFVAAFPAHVLEADLASADLVVLQQGKPVGKFQPAVPLTDVFLPTTKQDRLQQSSQPLLLVNVPLPGNADGRIAGVGQFIIEGHSIAAEFARLDRHLLIQAVLAFLAGGGVLAAVMAWAFHRLRRAHRLLADRNTQLIRANQELALAAKTSALGPLAAHLIHGLSTPLAGLQNFMHSRTAEQPSAPDTEWQEALASTRRMKELVGEIVRLMAAENGTDSYEVTLEEAVTVVRSKTEPLAQAAGVRLVIEGAADEALSNRHATLVMLILENLLQNAIEASARGDTVRLSLRTAGEDVVLEVGDQASGLPEPVRRNLFTPIRSTKPGGNGLGLAISKQLANQLGARLELVRSTPEGTVFALSLPAPLLTSTPVFADSPPVQ